MSRTYMSRCLRCSKLCEANAAFCDECRSLLPNQLQQRPFSHASQVPSSTASTIEDTPTLPEHNAVQGDPSEHITSPLPIVEADQTPQPAALVTHEDPVEQAVSMLNEAAQRIAEGEDPAKSDRKARLYSRVSRLRPIPDISADIRRESTPLPQVSSSQPGEPVSVSKGALNRHGRQAHRLGKGDSMPGL